MKKLNIITSVLFSALTLFSVQACNLISSAGFDNKGLPVKETTGDLSTEESVQNILDHSDWDKLLKANVSKDGLVDYEGFQKDRASLDKYLAMLSKNKPSKNWSVQEQLAYYINTYNAYTVDLILRNYPLKSIKDINGPWTKEFIPIGDVEMSLGGLENSILRKMNEPRIHFAINCASISCPKLLNEAYTSSKLEAQLEKVTREFINSKENQISINSANLSSIFDWYKKDFEVNGKSLIDYLNKYSTTKINNGAKISYKDYNWNLNNK